MKIDSYTAEYVAKLAKLEFSQEELEQIRDDMEKMISNMERLNELDTENVKPMEYIKSVNNVLREDRSVSSFERDVILGCAPVSEKGCYKAPKIME
jgi:aspartyl-tRNA(Asn)/glutamyl-tRNA(Gln) amidotransferase subunit C